MQQHRIAVDDIQIGERHRALSEDAVARLAGSMRDIGLRQPISIRLVEEMVVDGDLTAGVPVLVAGRHRLEAAKRLGWAHIDCIEVDDDAIKAEMWEIAENLHRLDLTKEQRDEHIRRYAELIEVREREAIVTHSGEQSVPRPVGRPVSINQRVADATGLGRETVRRALKPQALHAVPPPISEVDIRVRNRDRLMAAWNSVDDADRAWFRDWIDTPIMDHRQHAAR